MPTKRAVPTASTPSTAILQFTPFASSLTPEFWATLSRIKIDSLKLDESPISIWASYSAGRSLVDRETGKQVSLGSLLNLTGEAFSSPASVTSSSTSLKGTLINYNTIESFKQADKQALFQSVANELWNSISTSPSPSVAQMNTLFAITFADLKKYSFYYWFAFPAFIAKPAWTADGPWVRLEEHLESKDRARTVQASYGAHCNVNGPEELGACLMKPKHDQSGYVYGKVSTFNTFFADVQEQDEKFLVFMDPSSDVKAIGWPLRNILAYLFIQHQATKLRIIALRATIDDSITASISMPEGQLAYDLARPVSVGWEKNTAGKLSPRLSDLGALMDPKRLADQAVDLNLKLMRWRILPSLNLEKIQQTKCLLLGAGTLGCYVSRTLMAWGVRKITLVDSGKVSYSNPVRQPLFEFQDCMAGGKAKAACAAEALRRIYPSIDAVGIQMAIPMPGHPIPPANLEGTRQAVIDLEKLMDDHDVIYLLMDSRESRWLPTLLGAAKGKLIMNAALGFDSYLVMRHGMLDQALDQRLGCYYCNDIVAPMDSLSDRTLDQMCTVTRPGLAAIASATAVELMTSTLQHPKSASAPSEIEGNTESASVLGAVPHQIRGFLSNFNQLKITGRAYEGFGMLHKAFDDAKYLEQITGLDKLQEETEAALEAVDWVEEDEDF